MPALFYFHVAKTAGNSMIGEISQHFADSEILTDGGNLTVPFLQACGEQRLRDTGLIHGHVGPGAAIYLQGIADTILMLRDPMDHAISHYLYLVREPGDRQRTAIDLGFRGFIHTYPALLSFQAISLANGLGQIVPPERPWDCLPDMLRYLESTFLLGTVDQIDEFMASLARIKQWPVPVSVRHVNKATPYQMLARAELEEDYDAMARSSHYGAVLIAVEQAIYAATKRIGALQREQRSLVALGETARRVWRSACGEIVLGHNFGGREIVDGEPAWWTLEATECHIHVATQKPATLQADIRVWHAVDPTCIQVWADQHKLDAQIDQTSDGYGSITVPLSNLAKDRMATITLRFDPRNPATDPPWYPALLLYHFRLV
jgi:hypothetical protein